MNNVKLTEHQFHVVWTEAAGREGYSKKLFQNVLTSLEDKGKIITESKTLDDYTLKVISEWLYSKLSIADLKEVLKANEPLEIANKHFVHPTISVFDLEALKYGVVPVMGKKE